MGLNFTLRTLAVAVAAIAVGLGALLNPTTRVAAFVVNGVLIAVLAAACLAVGSRPPARSFCLGFALACLGTLMIDELGRREIIVPVVFTQPLVLMAENVLPPIPALRGELGTTLYFRQRGGLPILVSILGDDGTTVAAGVMTMDQIERDGILDKIGPLEDLPHYDDIPKARDRTTICRYVLASIMGIVGGLVAYAVRRRSDLRAANGRPA